MINPVFVLICRRIEVTPTIHVPRAVNSRADWQASKAMDTQESKEWPSVYVNPRALSVST